MMKQNKSFNRLSYPSDLRITDIRFAMIEHAPMDCTLLKISTNSELEGYGEVRDWSSPSYAKILKSRLVGENPCDVDRLFRIIKQFGGQSRQGGGVSGIEVALWDLAGKAYGVPVYELLGGSFHSKIRVYADTDCEGKNTGENMGSALKKRRDSGFTFLKMDLGVDQLLDIPDALSAPAGYIDDLKISQKHCMFPDNGYTDTYRNALKTINIAHPYTILHITKKGFDILDEYMAKCRSIVGYTIPLAIDHVGHIDVTDCIKLCKMLEKYNIAWVEDALPWQNTDQYKRLAEQVAVPLCTGEDIYLKENFKAIIDSGAVSVIHPDVLTSGGLLETKKISDLAEEKGIAMAIHMAESPIACLAAANVAKASANFIALEFHSFDVPWWNDLVTIKGRNKIVDNGFITVPEGPGLGIDSLNDEVIKEHMHHSQDGIWLSTDEWNKEWSYDRLWS